MYYIIIYTHRIFLAILLIIPLTEHESNDFYQSKHDNFPFLSVTLVLQKKDA